MHEVVIFSSSFSSLILLWGRSSSCHVYNAGHATFNLVEAMSQEMNEQVEQEGAEDCQLYSSNRVSHTSQEIVRSLQVILTESGAKRVDSEHGMLVEHMDDRNHD